jgi:hypothetical protein
MMRFFISIFTLFLTVQCVMGDENSPVTFPQNFDKGVLYFKNDRGSITEDIYISRQSMEAVQQGKPLPYGTVITLVEYFSKDEKGSDGYALKGSLKRYVVMEKRRGFGANRPISQRNGEWEYQAFNPDKSIQTSENLNRCFSCHSSQKNNDFVFTLNDIRDYQLK